MVCLGGQVATFVGILLVNSITSLIIGGFFMGEKNVLIYKGFEILRDCLREYINEEMEAKYGADYWKDEVYLKLNDAKIKIDGNWRDLDALNCLWLLIRHWDAVFSTSISKKYHLKERYEGDIYKSYVNELKEDRHINAHSKDDLSMRDTCWALNIMCHLIENINPASHDCLQKLWEEASHNAAISEEVKVTITSTKDDVSRGSTLKFRAEVDGKPSKAVSWSVRLNDSKRTKIENGILSVPFEETARQLTVIATSTFNNKCSGYKTVNVINVTSVKVSSEKESLGLGEKCKFRAMVEEINNLRRDVIWMVENDNDGKIESTIDSNGMLTVSENERASSLKIIAKSMDNEAIQDSKNINIVYVTDIVITKAPETLKSDNHFEFEANVTGSNISRKVEWVVNGGKGNVTESIIQSDTGYLYVGKDESAPSLEITAISVDNTKKKDTVSVKVINVIDVIIDPPEKEIKCGNSLKFGAKVNGPNNPSQEVSWEIEGKVSKDTKIDDEGILIVADNEKESSIYITAKSKEDDRKTGSAYVSIIKELDIIVIPLVEELKCGETYQFEARIKGTKEPLQDILWSVDVDDNSDTLIEQTGGKLKVAKNEILDTLTITATSSDALVKKGTKSLNVVNETNVEIFNVPPELKCGEEPYQLHALINGDFSKDIIWSLDNEIDGISISSSGLLTVASFVTSESLIVTAKSVKDPTKFDTANVSLRSTIKEIGSKGPAEGLIFYDKGEYTNGWRYLEAAPASSEFQAPWGLFGITCPGTNTGIGTGKTNTDIIINLLNANGQANKAAQICNALSINGINDWFLPSKEELEVMYSELCVKRNNIGGFGALYIQNCKENKIDWNSASSKWYYWSSSDYKTIGSLENTWVLNFKDGKLWHLNKAYFNRNCEYFVRAIRAF